jgi:hypothetical protein
MDDLLDIYLEQSQLAGAALSKYMIVYDLHRPAKSECHGGNVAP